MKQKELREQGLETSSEGSGVFGVGIKIKKAPQREAGAFLCGTCTDLG